MTPKKLVWAALGLALAAVLVPRWLPAGLGTGTGAAELLASGRWLVGAVLVFAGGLLTALTPCVYPLIPITVSIFGARQARERGTSLFLVTVYVLGMALVFTTLGLVAAKTGQAFGSALGSPWIGGALALFLLLLAASMFGAFDLAIPQALQQRLSRVGGAGLGGAFLMGGVSGFLAAPCTGPVLTGLLAFVAKSQSPALGASLLFIYAVGIGAPFFAVAMFAGKLPRGGVWMEWVKSVLGILLVAMAVLYLKDSVGSLRGLLDTASVRLGQTGGAVAAFSLVAAGVVCGAIHRSFKSDGRDFALKLAGVSLVACGLLVSVGALNAGRRATDLEWTLTFPSGDPPAVSVFDAQLASAKQAGRPVMIDFFADWCAACKELDRATYVAPVVVRESARFVRIKVDGTQELDAIEALYQRFRIQGLPTVVFLTSRGELLESPRVTGFIGPDELSAELRKVH